MKHKAVIVGAGALGLGFLAERLAHDYELCLADVQAKQEVLNQIEAQQGFSLNVCRLDGIDTRQVAGSFTVATADAPDTSAFDCALGEAALVLTATGVKILDRVVERIAPILNARARSGWLLFCENGQHAAAYAHMFGSNTTLVDTVMSRMCRFGDPNEGGYQPLAPGIGTALIVEDYDLLPLDASLCLPGPFSPVFSLVTPAEFACWEDIKFFLHNGMHAFLAYRAYLEGVRWFPDTPAWIRREAKRTMLEEVIPALVRTHPAADREQMEQYGLSLLERFYNPWFNDSIERGVRGVEEKLAPGERLMAGCAYIRKAGIEPRGYAATVQAAREILTRQRQNSPNRETT
jgi:mannitol-1-phosphate 5-dehydrogenase